MNTVMKLLREELGATAIEYVLTIGVVAGMALVLITGFKLVIPQVVELLCPAVDTAATAADAASGCVVK